MGGKTRSDVVVDNKPSDSSSYKKKMGVAYSGRCANEPSRLQVVLPLVATTTPSNPHYIQFPNPNPPIPSFLVLLSLRDSPPAAPRVRALFCLCTSTPYCPDFVPPPALEAAIDGKFAAATRTKHKSLTPDSERVTQRSDNNFVGRVLLAMCNVTRILCSISEVCSRRSTPMPSPLHSRSRCHRTTRCNLVNLQSPAW